MRIFIDIGHPAHVHYFRNFIKIMESKGHEFLVTARNRQYVFELLDAYGIKYVNRGPGSDSTLGKLFYLIKTSFMILSLSRRFKPDLFIDFGTIYPCLSSLLFRKRHIVFEDTEITGLYRFFYKPIATEIYTPECFEIDLGRKHKRFRGYMELTYLHPKYFKPDITVLKETGIEEGETFSIVRFVNWKAAHDIGSAGLSEKDKTALIHTLEKYGKVFISSEIPLQKDLQKYKPDIRAEKFHSLMHFASLVAGESATMASEAVILGTPAIYIDTAGRGYTRDLEKKFGMLHNYASDKKGIESAVRKAGEILRSKEMKAKAMSIREQIVSASDDVTALMIKIAE